MSKNGKLSCRMFTLVRFFRRVSHERKRVKQILGGPTGALVGGTKGSNRTFHFLDPPFLGGIYRESFWPPISAGERGGACHISFRTFYCYTNIRVVQYSKILISVTRSFWTPISGPPISMGGIYRG